MLRPYTIGNTATQQKSVNTNFKIIVCYFFKLIDFPKTSGKSPFLCVFFKSTSL